MNITVNAYSCPQNHPCPVINFCPVDAITQEGFGLPKVDKEKCIECMKCTKVCSSFSVDASD